MSMADYLADPCPVASLSAGIANTLITQSPLHAMFKHPKLSPDYRQEQDTKFDIGTAAHSIFLEGDDKVAVVEANDWRTKDAQAQRDLARSNGMVPLLSKHYAAVKAMVGVAREFVSTCSLSKQLVGAEAEVTCIAKVGETWIRTRKDLLSQDRSVLINYKTCENACPDLFSRRLSAMGYDLSAALYEYVMELLGHRAQEFFIAQEISPPYACSIVGLSEAAREVARGKLKVAIALWERCMKSGKWPGYTSQVCYATPSSWEMDAHEDRMLSIEDRLELGGQG